MSNLIFIAGIFTWFVAGVLLIFAALAGTAAAWKWATEKHDNHIWHSARSSFVERLQHDSWWFSEDAKVMRALQLYCEEIARGGANISVVRERWRSEFLEQTQQKDGG